MRSSNCEKCEYKKNNDGGWCYMFRNKPNGVCSQYIPIKFIPK
jgi:hypothetical protein